MVDALASGASVCKDVEVQVLSRVPIKTDSFKLSVLIRNYLNQQNSGLSDRYFWR